MTDEKLKQVNSALNEAQRNLFTLRAWLVSREQLERCINIGNALDRAQKLVVDGLTDTKED